MYDIHNRPLFLNLGDAKDLKTWEYESWMLLENGSNQLVTCSSKGRREHSQRWKLIAANHVERVLIRSNCSQNASEHQEVNVTNNTKKSM